MLDGECGCGPVVRAVVRRFYIMYYVLMYCTKHTSLHCYCISGGIGLGRGRYAIVAYVGLVCRCRSLRYYLIELSIRTRAKLFLLQDEY